MRRIIDDRQHIIYLGSCSTSVFESIEDAAIPRQQFAIPVIGSY